MKKINDLMENPLGALYDINRLMFWGDPPKDED
jgi:hypothetical protein